MITARKSTQEIEIIDPLKTLNVILTGRATNIPDEHLFWWISNVIMHLESFNQTEGFSAWEANGRKLKELSDTSQIILHNQLVQRETALKVGFDICRGTDPQFGSMVNYTIDLQFGSDYSLAHTPLMVKCVEFIKSNYPEGLYKKYESDFNSFLERKEVTDNMAKFYTYCLKCDFVISTFEGAIYQILKMKSDVTDAWLLSCLWIDYNTDISIYQNYGFALKEQDTRTSKFETLVASTKNDYQIQINNQPNWKANLIKIANPDAEWTLNRRELLERAFIYSTIVSHYLNAFNSNWNYVIKLI